MFLSLRGPWRAVRAVADVLERVCKHAKCVQRGGKHDLDWETAARLSWWGSCQRRAYRCHVEEKPRQHLVQALYQVFIPWRRGKTTANDLAAMRRGETTDGRAARLVTSSRHLTSGLGRTLLNGSDAEDTPLDQHGWRGKKKYSWVKNCVLKPVVRWWLFGWV